jgi:hypothetical protein
MKIGREVMGFDRLDRGEQLLRISATVDISARLGGRDSNGITAWYKERGGHKKKNLVEGKGGGRSLPKTGICKTLDAKIKKPFPVNKNLDDFYKREC